MFIKKINEFKKEYKKIAIIIFSVIFISIFFFSAAHADVVIDPPSSFPTLKALITAVINWFLRITSAITILFLIIGGIYYITAFGDDNRMKEGKRIITYAIYGLVLVLISYSVVLTVNNIIFG